MGVEDGSQAIWWDWKVSLQVQCRGRRMDIICSSESVGGSWHEITVERRFQAWCIRKGCRHSRYWELWRGDGGGGGRRSKSK